jgi:hypothetical protein
VVVNAHYDLSGNPVLNSEQTRAGAIEPLCPRLYAVASRVQQTAFSSLLSDRVLESEALVRDQKCNVGAGPMASPRQRHTLRLRNLEEVGAPSLPEHGKCKTISACHRRRSPLSVFVQGS